MKAKLTEHLLCVIVVSLILLGAVVLLKRNTGRAETHEYGKIREFLAMEVIDGADPFHKALLKDVMNIFYPGQYDKNREKVAAIIRYKERAFTESLQKSPVTEGLSGRKFAQLVLMYLKFLLVYVLVMFLTYYGVQTFGALRFVLRKRASLRDAEPKRKSTGRIFAAAGKKAGTGIVSFILFCPAYVIAYSIRTEFNTDTTFFMVLLALVSNGLLITYTNKFYAFLVAESRKGYVETAIVKNLKNSYLPGSAEGIPYRDIFRLRKRFDGHVFGHIFANARYQYIATIKEQATFLITGLIIIEMALNIHGHLNYEMLRQILYRNYAIVIVIVLGIFYAVKMTEIVTDIMLHRESLRYEN